MKQYGRFFQSAVTALTVVLCGTTAAGQTPDDDQPEPAQVQLLPRTEFRLSAEHISAENLMFVWDMNFGGELDVIDYGTGRATFVANYQAILGDEFRYFDPNQGNYILIGSAAMRTRGGDTG